MCVVVRERKNSKLMIAIIDILPALLRTGSRRSGLRTIKSKKLPTHVGLHYLLPDSVIAISEKLVANWLSGGSVSWKDTTQQFLEDALLLELTSVDRFTSL